VAASVGASVPAAHLAALEAAREFRLARHAVSAEQVDRLGRELPLPHLLVPAVDADAIGPQEISILAKALAGAVGMLAAVPKGAE